MPSPDRDEPKEFLDASLDAVAGGVITLRGGRVLLLSPDLLHALRRDLEATIGRAGGGVFYRSGEADGPRLVREARRAGGEEEPADVHAWFSLVDTVFRRRGLGTIELVTEEQAGRRYTFRLVHSATSAETAAQDRPICHLYAGWIAGILRQVARGEYRVDETACAGVAGGTCSMVARRTD